MLKRLDAILLPISALAFSALYLFSTAGMTAESTIFPRTVMAALCLFGAGVAVAELRSAGSERRRQDKQAGAPAVFLLSVAYVIGFWLIGFALAAPVFLAATMILLGQPWLRSILVALLLPAAIFGLFSVGFGVNL